MTRDQGFNFHCPESTAQIVEGELLFADNADIVIAVHCDGHPECGCRATAAEMAWKHKAKPKSKNCPLFSKSAEQAIDIISLARPENEEDEYNQQENT